MTKQPAISGVATAAAPTIDPITVEVLGNALASIVEEMGETLVRAAYSTNVKERRDSSTCLFDVHGKTLCQAMHIPMHLGSLMGVVEHVTARHPVDAIREGDVFIGNDAYTGGGTHLPDIVMVEPVFVDGVVVAWATNIAHHADFVDRGHAHIYQEGLRIPPVQFYREGRVQQDVLDLILLNCQVPRERLNDLRAQMAANRQGIQRFQTLCRKYGTGLVRAACEALLDYTERMTRAGIRTIPAGVYTFEYRFDSDEIDGEAIFTVRIDVAGDEMTCPDGRALIDEARAVAPGVPAILLGGPARPFPGTGPLPECIVLARPWHPRELARLARAALEAKE